MLRNATVRLAARKYFFLQFDGWVNGCFEFFYRRSTPKGHIEPKQLYKNTILHNEHVYKRLKIFKIDRIIKTIGKTIKT